MTGMPNIRGCALTIMVLASCGAGATLAAAAEASKPAPSKAAVEFNHLGGKSKIFTLDMRDRETFVIRIKNTCPEAFDYAHVGVERGESTRLESEAPQSPLSDKDLEVTHDARFGGYVVSITPKPGVQLGDKCTGAEKLGAASFIVSVRESDFGVSFSGGFTVSGLTNPVYSVTGEAGKKTVIEETDKQDTHRLGAASFVHAFHDKLKIRALGDLQPALALGLGINTDNRAEYLIGGGLRLGDKATLNAGKVWGAVSRLPNGIALGPVKDDNVLNNLGSRVVSRWFFALTYSFIDTKSRLLKPFAESTAAGPGSPSTEDPAASEAVKKLAADKETYAKLEGVKDLPDHVTPCKAVVTGPKTELVITVHWKGATEADKAVLKAKEPLAAGLLTSKATAGGTKAKVKSVTFDDKCE